MSKALVLRGRLEPAEDGDPAAPGVVRVTFATERVSLTAYSFDPGASFPTHAHADEQLTHIAAGSVDFTIGGTVHALRRGDIAVVPGEVPHGILAGDDGARVICVFSPPRASEPD